MRPAIFVKSAHKESCGTSKTSPARMGGTIDNTESKVRLVPKSNAVFAIFLKKDSKNQNGYVNKCKIPMKNGTTKERSGSKEYISLSTSIP